MAGTQLRTEKQTSTVNTPSLRVSYLRFFCPLFLASTDIQGKTTPEDRFAKVSMVHLSMESDVPCGCFPFRLVTWCECPLFNDFCGKMHT